MINGRIAMIARQRGERPEAVRAELQKSGGLQEVARQIVEHKAADRIVDQASVTDIPAEEWNDIAKDKAEARRTGGSTATKKKTTKKTAKKTDSAKGDSKKAATKKSASKKKTTKKKKKD